MELYHDNRLLFGKDGKSQPRYKVFLSEVQQGRTPVSVLHFRDVRHTDEDAKGLAKLVGKGMMSFPKPVRLSTSAKPPITQSSGKAKSSGSSSIPSQSANAAPANALAGKQTGGENAGKSEAGNASEEGDMVMDFFAGSCTTAHIVMKLNKEDGGNRRLIMVQLPEKCGEKNEAFKAGYPTIADIGQERIRRAVKQLEDKPSNPKPDKLARKQPLDAPAGDLQKEGS